MKKRYKLLGLVVFLYCIVLLGKPNEENTNIWPTDVVILEIEESPVTITGMSYFSDSGYAIGNYGKNQKDDLEQKASIILFDNEFTYKESIMLPTDVTNIQGVSWNKDGQGIWFTDTKKIYLIDMEGVIQQQIEITEYDGYRPNGLIYDARDNTLWTLCTEEFLFHIDMEGHVLEVIKCDYLDQDQICFDEEFNILFTVGADYDGVENYVGKIDMMTRTTEIIYCCRDSYAVEGIVIIGDEMFIANDGIYHDAKIAENYIACYLLGE